MEPWTRSPGEPSSLDPGRSTARNVNRCHARLVEFPSSTCNPSTTNEMGGLGLSSPLNPSDAGTDKIVRESTLALGSCQNNPGIDAGAGKLTVSRSFDRP
ncbi:hypothetical protein C1H46_025097 [Malus baccata]|uniref:Uncharacterized protein n=1 Tax=Malus baccata TaxID=106549 RepID=A0A540LS96_MALBA|nr:hypothetical protein C1H46_025097 [Malus baccata]